MFSFSFIICHPFRHFIIIIIIIIIITLRDSSRLSIILIAAQRHSPHPDRSSPPTIRKKGGSYDMASAASWIHEFRCQQPLQSL